MPLDFTTVNLDALIQHPDDRVATMNRVVLDKLVTGECDKVLIRGRKYFVTLERIIDDNLWIEGEK